MLDASSSAAGSVSTRPGATREMRVDLRKLERARKSGFTRVGIHWRAGSEFISHSRASWLTASGFAAILYFGRTVRLKITNRGLEAINAKDQPS